MRQCRVARRSVTSLVPRLHLPLSSPSATFSPLTSAPLPLVHFFHSHFPLLSVLQSLLSSSTVPHPSTFHLPLLSSPFPSPPPLIPLPQPLLLTFPLLNYPFQSPPSLIPLPLPLPSFSPSPQFSLPLSSPSLPDPVPSLPAARGRQRSQCTRAICTGSSCR